MTLLVTGWVALDDIETPFGKIENALGGSASYAAYAGALFTDVRLLAAVGEDFPRDYLEMLSRPRIDSSGVLVIEGKKTSRWGARYDYDMNDRETWYPERGVSLEWKPVLPAGWEDSTGGCIAAGRPDYQADLLRSLTAPRATMVDTIKMYVQESPEELRATMAMADFVTANESEARELTGMASIARAARALVSSARRGVIIKLGEYGAAVATPTDYFVAPGYPLEEVIDPTGAGDAFAGGFMGYLDTVPEATPGEIRRAVIYGSTTASFAVEGMGISRLLTLTRDEVDSRYRAFRNLTHFDAGE